MSRKLATIRTIKDIQPIPDADLIERIQIDGWWCVSKKGEFKVGDKCVYFEIDSLLPLVKQFEFLASRGTKKMLCDGNEVEGYRLRTVKLRGQISQGLALPLSLFPEVDESMDDVTELLNVLLYEPPIPACLAGDVEGAFPNFIPKTDEERVQNSQELLDTYRGRAFTLTEKLDGTSSTYFNYEGNFGVCGRNWQLKETKGNTYWEMAYKYDLMNLIPEGYAIQGEIIGEGIQKNKLKIKGHELRIFSVWVIENKKYLSNYELFDFCDRYALKHVPIINDTFILHHTIDELLLMAEGKSQLCETTEREGIVFVVNTSGQKVSFKAISNNFLAGEK